MSARLTIYVNERPVTVALGATLLDVVTGLDGDLAAALRTGTAIATDGVGRPVAPSAPVAAGSIFRVVRSARRSPPPDAGA